MITRADLDAAIAECVGERDPNANTCIKLAAFYTIRNELYPEAERAALPVYSYAAEPEQTMPTVHIDSDSEFAQTVEGLPPDRVWSIIDELMDAVSVSQPAMYRAVIRRLNDL